MTSRVEIPGIILAGGRSRRMGGGDKFMLPFGPSTLLQQVIDRVRSQLSGLVLSYNGDPEAVAGYGLTVIADRFEDCGPLAGILTGLRWAEEQGSPWLYSCAADVPFVPDDFCARLWAGLEREKAELAVAKSGGRLHPVMALWSVSLARDLEKFLVAGGRRMTDWLGRHKLAEVVWPEEPDPFFNINRPEDLEMARQRQG